MTHLWARKGACSEVFDRNAGEALLFTKHDTDTEFEHFIAVGYADNPYIVGNYRIVDIKPSVDGKGIGMRCISLRFLVDNIGSESAIDYLNRSDLIRQADAAKIPANASRNLKLMLAALMA